MFKQFIQRLKAKRNKQPEGVDSVASPPSLWTLGPAQIELFDDDLQVVEFLKKQGYENIKVEVVTPVKEGKKAVVFRRLIKTPVV